MHSIKVGTFAKFILASFIAATLVTGFCACGGTDNNKTIQPSNNKTTDSTDAGLASAANRKAIIQQLGKNYQKSAGGQYRKRIAKIAPFKIQLVNGQQYTSKDLAPDQAAVLIYFSPECEECQHFTTALIKRLDELKQKQLVFITFEPLEAVKTFYKKNQLQKYPQIKMGTEGYSFIVQKYYKVEHFPFVASYDDSGNLIGVYTDNTQPEKLATEI